MEEIFDVVVQTTGFYLGSFNDWEECPPPKADFKLGLDLWLGKIPYGVKSCKVLDACEPAGFNFQPTRQYGARYSICRKVNPPSSEHFEWDHDGVIGRTLFLSRLIHPTTIASHYSARLFFQNKELSSIAPGRVQGYGTYVWIVATNWRDWLSQAETEQIKNLLPIYIQNASDRVRRARSHIDHAFHAFYLDQRTASLVSGFESLLKVERYAATAQFKLRVPALARMINATVTADEAEVLYDDRSVYVHGRAPNYSDVSDEVMERYNKFETVLRCALLRASTDSAFGSLFSTDASIVGAFGRLP